MQGVLPYEVRRAKRSSRGVRGNGARLLAVGALLLAAWFVLGVLLDARERGSRADVRPAPSGVIPPVDGGDRGPADRVARGGGARVTSS
jgi:hypothetical protein